MNAIEIKGLTKNFGSKRALDGLNMTVPEGAIYGFIGENGSGKSTTEKIICGLIKSDGGEIKLFGKNHTDTGVRAKVGVLIETPGCYPNYSVWNNMLLQAANLGIKNAKEQVRKVLKTVRMEGSASNKFKNCSLGMKQRIGIAMALLGDPALLILDEPINGLDADGMRIMREVLTDITKKYRCSVVISSHILGELEKIATHYGIIRGGRMIREMTAEELKNDCRTFIAINTSDSEGAMAVLAKKYSKLSREDGLIRIYDGVKAEDVAAYLYGEGITVSELVTGKIGLEEYYTDIMEAD
ncbi:MAG: ATP-binding cassette domain-containing protein [Clostridia bacterium]|nr:ATP-binding cassette domain-containing protein [Clostridia bacterium]